MQQFRISHSRHSLLLAFLTLLLNFPVDVDTGRSRRLIKMASLISFDKQLLLVTLCFNVLCTLTAANDAIQVSWNKRFFLNISRKIVYHYQKFQTRLSSLFE